MRIRSAAVATFAVALTTAMSVSTAFAQTTILFNSFFPPAHFINNPLKDWGAEVGNVTDGRVKVEFLPTSAAPPPQQIDGAVSGQYDAAVIFHGFTGRRAVLTQMAQLPFFVAGTAEDASAAFWRTYVEFFAEADEWADDGRSPPPR